MDKRFRQLLICLSLLVIISCSSIDCPVANTTRLDGKNILLDITTRENDQKVLLNRLTGKSSFSLPISYSHPEDILYFCFTDSVKTLVDTVWIKKDDIPHFESVDCAAAFFHELTDVKHTHHAIDSLVLINTSVDYDVQTVHFYLYPKTGN